MKSFGFFFCHLLFLTKFGQSFELDSGGADLCISRQKNLGTRTSISWVFNMGGIYKGSWGGGLMTLEIVFLLARFLFCTEMS